MVCPLTYSVWRCIRLGYLHPPRSLHFHTAVSRNIRSTSMGCSSWKKDDNGSQGKKDISNNSSSNTDETLKSSAFVQTGSELKEIPLILSRLVPSIYSFNKTFSYSGEAVRDIPSVDVNLMSAFHSSQSITELCRRLDIPYSYIGGYSASLALEKLCRLRQKNTSLYQEESFIARAVMKELFFTVTKEVHSLDNTALKRLISCRFAHADFDLDCFRALYGKFLERLHMKVYGVLELCAFSDVLCAYDSVDSKSDILQRIWEHVSARVGELHMNQLTRVYTSVPEKQAFVFASLETCLRRNLFKLDFIEIFTISREVQLKSQRKQELMMVSKWAEKNIKTITRAQLLQLLKSFNASGFIDIQLLTLLEQYGQTVLQLGQTDDADVICAVLSYLTMSRYYDNGLLELACEHYINDTHGYTEGQLHALLKAVGILNYIPKRQRVFFSKVEQQLLDDFYKLDCLPLLDMFVYLIYVGRVAVNFKPYIFSSLFLGLIQDMSGSEYDQAVRNLHLIEEAFSDIGFQPRYSITVDNSVLFRRLNRQEYEHFHLNNKLREALADILGPHMYHAQPRPTFEEMYHEILCDSRGNVIQLNSSGRFSFKIAVMLLNDDSFSQNVLDHMLGPESTNFRMLQARGMKIIGVHKKDILHYQRNNTLRLFIKSLLSRYIITE